MVDLLHCRLLHTPGFLLEQVDDELLIFHPTNDLVVYCNRTAGLVWSLCNGERTVLAIAQLLAQTYPESEAAVRLDVVDAAQTLLGKGALVLAPAHTLVAAPPA